MTVVEIGITIREGMQGKHYAKEIIKGLIEYGFEKLQLPENVYYFEGI